MPQIVLTRADVDLLMTPKECVDTVERAFRLWGEGGAAPPAALGVHVSGGGFHVKAATLRDDRHYFVAKTNGNFPGNPAVRGIPSIQGVIVLSDADDGTPLAVMDSIRITELRTAAATAVAARHLAVEGAEHVGLVGCGAQALSQLEALAAVLPLRSVRVYDTDPSRAQDVAGRATARLGVPVEVRAELAEATLDSEVVVTCTTAQEAFLEPGMVSPGTLVAAVGADSPEKQEITPELMAAATVIVDSLEQCLAFGDLRHAVAAAAMTAADVGGSLGEVVAGRAPGRTSPDEIVVFDSTGTALQDVAAAARVYTRAAGSGRGVSIDLAAG